MDVPFQVRPATDPDLADVARIERAVFSDPWPPSAFRELGNAWAWVAVEGGRVVGYLFGRVAADEAEILNLAVHPEHRRLGVARHLLETALGRFRSAGARTVYLEVRSANQPAMTFYRSHGFETVGKRRRYYQNPPDDAVVMARPIDLE
jgi:ribosomal-protein-alanine N-acetyltransferase